MHVNIDRFVSVTVLKPFVYYISVVLDIYDWRLYATEPFQVHRFKLLGSVENI